MPSNDTRRINPPASTKSVTCFKKTRRKYAPLLSNDGTRDDKRTLDEIRPMYIKPGNMTGFAFCESVRKLLCTFRFKVSKTLVNCTLTKCHTCCHAREFLRCSNSTIWRD